jgi:hypothetical protein
LKGRALTLSEHLLLYAFTDIPETLDKVQEIEIQNFVVTLCIYRDDDTHPYYPIIKSGANELVTAYYLDKDVQQMVLDVFGIDNWQVSKLLEKDSQGNLVYIIPDGIGMPTSPFSYKNESVVIDGNTVIVSFDLYNSELYEYESTNYGSRTLVYEIVTDSSRSYLRFHEFSS